MKRLKSIIQKKSQRKTKISFSHNPKKTVTLKPKISLTSSQTSTIIPSPHLEDSIHNETKTIHCREDVLKLTNITSSLLIMYASVVR